MTSAQSSLDERKIEILEAVEMFADVVRGDADFSERHKARQAFRAALDEALVDPEVERLRDLLRRAYRICGPNDLARDIEEAVPDV